MEEGDLFETILLNLAISDLLASTTGFIGTSLVAYYYLKNIKYNYSTLAVVYVMTLLSVTTSTVFIVVIAIERLKAIKMPLKYRALHAGKTKTRRMIIFTWLGNAVLMAILLIMVFIVADFKPNTSTTYSQYTVGGYLCTGFLFTIVLYSWIAYLLLKRNSTFLAFDPKDKENKASIIKAARKEKASIFACVLVIATFVCFNMPYAVTAFSGRVHGAAMACMIANSVANPLVYFFKTYAERRFKNNKVNFNSTGSHEEKKTKESTRDLTIDDVSPEFTLDEKEVTSIGQQ
eukprot:gene6870-7645_t